uniref:Uncharacterized protein n=1 Tax=Arundo donax TaxID=35708 RepID=A0A0A9HTA3_ARUDO
MFSTRATRMKRATATHLRMFGTLAKPILARRHVCFICSPRPALLMRKTGRALH